MAAEFARALAEALAVLRELPRGRHATGAARTRFRQFESSHPEVSCHLLIDAKPASETVDYDILITVPGAGTVSLAWRPDEGIPWTPLYAEHWAANFVVSVDDRATSIQSALIYLSGALQRRPDLMRDLVDRTLISAAIERAPPTVDEAELEVAVDAFRIGKGLHSGAATQLWLDEMRLTMDTLRELVAQNLQFNKFKDAMTACQVEPYFAAHSPDFERLTVMRLEAMTRNTARKIARAWRQLGTCPVFDGKQFHIPDPTGRLETLFAFDLPGDFAGEPEGAVIGPVVGGDGLWVGQILRRRAARLDHATRRRIGNLLFEQWLADRRSKANIRWHWV